MMWPWLLFPAHAGVILSGSHNPRTCRAIPRPRGGDPAIACIVEDGLGYSPPTRG